MCRYELLVNDCKEKETAAAAVAIAKDSKTYTDFEEEIEKHARFGREISFFAKTEKKSSINNFDTVFHG